MRPGRYAATDGSFARSAGGAGVRGLALLALALLIGVVLLNATDADPPGTNVSTKSTSSTKEKPTGGAAGATTTTVAPTTTQPAHAPKDVKAIVSNASAVKGAAAGGRNALLAAQYNALAPANSPAPVPDSSVYFTPGYDRDALAVATVLQLPGTAVKPLPAPPPFDTKGANVVVVLGADAAPRFGTQAATTT